ncbi:MAG TPA: alpha/beta fold hydrolase [Gaiellaceae bacterium]
MSARSVELPDGRRLAVHEGGDPTGRIVVYHHGTPSDGSLYRPWIEDAKRRGIRLVGYDRPGYGGSTRRPGRRVVDAVRDVEAIVEALGGGPYATWGVSGGAPHALACAAASADGLVAAASLAAPAPYGAEGLDWLDGMGDANVAEFGASLEGESKLRPLLDRVPGGIARRGARAHAGRDVVGALRGRLCGRLGRAGRVPPRDDQRRSRAERRRVARRRSRLRRRPGFELGELPTPTLLLQGQQDLMVPPAHFRWLEGRLPSVEARFADNEGHLTLIERVIPAVHEWLLRFF